MSKMYYKKTKRVEIDQIAFCIIKIIRTTKDRQNISSEERIDNIKEVTAAIILRTLDITGKKNIVIGD